MRILLSTILVSVILIGCQERQSNSAVPKIYDSEEFKAYWQAGKAEVNSYRLSQSRYGETRNGNAVLIFVTEDFSKKNHVKLDHPEKVGTDKVNVLKLNFTKNFVTGIYPYSMMLSVFTPVNREKYPFSLKIVMSAQEWCGQVYTQMNLRGNRYNIQSHSYFETEGDQTSSIRRVLLEDEIWNMIRLDHHHLPVGEIKILPGLFFTRLNHTDLKTEPAYAKKQESASTYTYKITFASHKRTLIIDFEKRSPHKILSWEETWLEKNEPMRSSGILDQTLYLDYWNKNSNTYLHLRDSLNLPLQ